MGKLSFLMLAPLPPPFAGPEISTEILLNAGLKDHFNFTFIKSNIRKANTEKGRFDIIGASRFSYILLQLIYKIIKNKPKVIYLLLSQNKIGFLRDSIYILISKFFSCKVVVHLRGSNFLNFYNSLFAIYKRYVNYILKKVDKIILQSPSLYSQFSIFVDINKIDILPNCIDIEKIDIVPPISKNTKNKKIILYVGYLSYAKGFYDLLCTVPLIVKKNPLVEFWFIGEELQKERNIILPIDRQKIKEAERIRKDLSSYLKYLGVVEHSKIFGIMKASDIFVLPSYSEGFPMVVLEAMACGLPVIASRTGAIPDFLKEGESGYLINPGNIMELAEKIIFLLENYELCKNMGKANRIYVENNLTLRHIIPKFIKIIYDVSY